MTPFVTPNADFYRIDTALVAPQVRTEDYTLRIHGMVDDEIELSYDDLLARPMVERDITLTCVSNEVGGRYVGNARWLGHPARRPAREAGVQPGADQVVGRSVDGYRVRVPGRRRARRARRARRRRHERRAAADRARLPRPPRRPRALRLRLGDEVADRDRAHDVRRVRPLLGRGAAGPSGRRSS